jgi:hypothetical protein
MAESNVIAPIFRWANGWIADDIFTGINNSYFYSENIEIRENSKGISLSKKLVQDTATTNQIRVITKAKSDLLIAWGNGWICYKCDNWTWSAVSTWNNQARYSAAVFNSYVYRCSDSALYKVAISDFSSSSVTPTKVTDLSTTTYHPMLVSMGDLYIWNGSKLSKVDVSNVFSDLFTMETWGIITKLNDLGWAIRVITQSALWNSNIYLWDGVSDIPDETIPLIWYVTYQSQIYNGYPYLVTNRGLGILDWYKIYPLKKCDDFASIDNWIWIYNERLVIAGKNWIYSWGAKNKNYNEVLSYDYVASGDVTAIFSDWIDLYVAWKKTWDTTTYWIDKLSNSAYNTSWYLITRWYYANSLKEIKEWILAWIGYSTLTTWQSIEIQYSVNGWSFETLRTITPTTDTIESFTEDLFVRDRFQYIQFKIILNWWGTNTPSFYALDFMFNNNIKR